MSHTPENSLLHDIRSLGTMNLFKTKLEVVYGPQDITVHKEHTK